LEGLMDKLTLINPPRDLNLPARVRLDSKDRPILLLKHRFVQFKKCVSSRQLQNHIPDAGLFRPPDDQVVPADGFALALCPLDGARNDAVGSRTRRIFGRANLSGSDVPQTTHSKKQATYSSSSEEPSLHETHASTQNVLRIWLIEEYP
jgi:hypothetical protein